MRLWLGESRRQAMGCRFRGVAALPAGLCPHLLPSSQLSHSQSVSRTSLSCSCVFPAPPRSVLTRLPIALEGPAPSLGVHISDPATRSRSADIFLRYVCRSDYCPRGMCYANRSEPSVTPVRCTSLLLRQTQLCTQLQHLTYTFYRFITCGQAAMLRRVVLERSSRSMCRRR